MSLSSSEMKEIQSVVRKEIRNFLETSTIKQFEEKIVDRVQKEFKKGKLEKEMKETVQKIFTEFYKHMWDTRNQWENKLKNA